MSSTLIFVGLPEDSKSSITKPLLSAQLESDHLVSTVDLEHSACNTCVLVKERGVPNAPKSCIAEIFNGDTIDGGSPVKNGSSRPRAPRDTPTRPRDTHSRLFGQSGNSSVAPMITDNIRSNIQFGDSEMNGSPAHSPKMNGSVTSTPSRVSYTPPKRNPVTGDGVPLPPPRRRHPAASLRGASYPNTYPIDNLLEPQPAHRYITSSWTPQPDRYHVESTTKPVQSIHTYPIDNLLEPQPAHRYITSYWTPQPDRYYVESTIKPVQSIRQNPYTLLGLETDDPEKSHPIIDSLSPQLVLDRHWPPFPAQHYLEPQDHYLPHHPLPPHAFVGMTSALGERPQPDYKYNPIPTLNGPIDTFTVAKFDPPPNLFKYDRDGPIPDVTPLQTSSGPGPSTLSGFPPIFHKYVPGYLFNLNRNAEDFNHKTYYVDYAHRRELEGNPITGDGYKSLNGQINTVTSVNGNSNILHNRVPPGGYSSGLW